MIFYKMFLIIIIIKHHSVRIDHNGDT